MKNLISIAIIITLFSCSSSQTGASRDKDQFHADTTQLTAGTAFYQCPMHPKIISTNPGDCPECGMALEQRVKQ